MVRNILIFDDDKARLDSLNILLNMCDDLRCCGSFPNAADAANAVAITQPDLVLMDIDMPGVDGISGTRQIKQMFPDLPVIMQTVFEDNKYIFDALKAGANGYVLKKTTPDKFLLKIREALDGGAPMTSTIAIKVLQFFQEKPVPEDYNLGKRELEILKLLAEGNSYKMISEACDITYKTVCTHINNIYKKLHVNSATEAVSLAIKNKIV